MRRRRMGRPGLVGTMARTAVVAGTATAVVGGVSGRRQQKTAASAQTQQAAVESQTQLSDMQQQMDQMEAQQAPVAAPAPADDMIAEIQKLASLHSSGVLDDAEFSAAKAKLLAG